MIIGYDEKSRAIVGFSLYIKTVPINCHCVFTGIKAERVLASVN